MLFREKAVFFCLQFLEVVGDFFALHALTARSASNPGSLEHLQLARREFFNCQSRALHDGHF